MELAGKRVIKRFRVAREGQTVDGRSISRQQILEMATSYSPTEYGARINCEHIFGMTPDSNMTSFGDVLAVDAKIETFTINGVNVDLMCLYATLSALPQLIALNKQGKKIYTSIEFYPKFADTGMAYLVGLAITDTPASRGLEPLKFSTTHADTLFSIPEELPTDTNEDTMTATYSTAPAQQPAPQPVPNQQPAPIETAPVPPQAPQTAPQQHQSEGGFLQKMSSLFGAKSAGMLPEEQEMVFNSFATLHARLDDFEQKFTPQPVTQPVTQADTTATPAPVTPPTLQEQLTATQTELAQLKQTLANTQAHSTTVPPVTGAGNAMPDY